MWVKCELPMYPRNFSPSATLLAWLYKCGGWYSHINSSLLFSAPIRSAPIEISPIWAIGYRIQGNTLHGNQPKMPGSHRTGHIVRCPTLTRLCVDRPCLHPMALADPSPFMSLQSPHLQILPCPPSFCRSAPPLFHTCRSAPCPSTLPPLLQICPPP